MSQAPSAKEAVGILKSVLDYVAGLIIWFCLLVASLSIAWLLMSASLRALGHNWWWLARMGPTELAYLCGAWALYMWRR